MIKFDAERCIRGLHNHLVSTMKKAQSELLREIQSGVIHPEADWTEGEIEEFIGAITAHVIGGAWAIMDEFGRGSKMDMSNPSLQEYIGGFYWNPLRRDKSIRGRPEGTYIDIWGNTRYSRGSLAGVNLEELDKQKPARFQGDFQPWEPSKAMRTAMQVMQKGRFKEIIQEAVNAFPWAKYLIVKG